MNQSYHVQKDPPSTPGCKTVRQPEDRSMRSTHYNHIAGQSLPRLASLSDGVFSIAMTLLVLDLRVPMSTALHLEQPLWTGGVIAAEIPLWNALLKLWPSLLAYFMSFLTLGIFWVGQQTQLNHFARSDRHLAWIHLAFLLAVSLMPFSTGLLAAFITYRLALVVYWLNILVLGAALYSSLWYAKLRGLMKDEVTDEKRSAHEQRILVAQSLYAFGALLCIINTYWSLVFIVLIQLNYALAPRLPVLDRL